MLPPNILRPPNHGWNALLKKKIEKKLVRELLHSIVLTGRQWKGWMWCLERPCRDLRHVFGTVCRGTSECERGGRV
jgi:hypothetical protein